MKMHKAVQGLFSPNTAEMCCLPYVCFPYSSIYSEIFECLSHVFLHAVLKQTECFAHA